MGRADGTLIVFWPIIHGLKPVATISVGPMALRKRVILKLIEIDQPIQGAIEPIKVITSSPSRL